MKCHPDRATQLGLPKTAIKVNLKAIQNLNSYVDGVSRYEKGGRYPFSSSDDTSLVEIEFVMTFDGTSTNNNVTSDTKGAAQPTTSRRKVELQVPSPQLPLTRVQPYVQKQVIKLLRMADLPVPKLDLLEIDEEDDGSLGGGDARSTASIDRTADQVLRKTPWDRSRDRFLRRINWNKFDRVYKQALKDANADLQTTGMIRNNPKLRRLLLAKILSHIQFSEQVSALERLVAYRRLLRLLDERFDYLELENFGQYWENLRMFVSESRPYNTSSSAMRKRRLRHQETGYRFTIHHDNSVTIQIPVDFREDELTQELHRNVRDFYEWTQQDNLGLDAIMEDES